MSQKEWKLHGAVKDINNTHDDIEAIYVVAEPEEVSTYLNLIELFKNIQYELDASWSILGEVYAIHPTLKSLGLSGLAIRRLRSNLDNLEEFSKTVPYVASRISLSTANAELTNLLVEPLYGNKPEVGVRELLQNAVDACRELEDYLKQNLNVKPSVTAQKANVKVDLYIDPSGNRWLEITDCGIGMTVETVKNYFLTIGASFRASNVWKKQHISEEGKSRILRSGRFGIGVLAAFLIGDKVNVVTRHVSQPVDRAVSFSFQVSDAAIELRYVKAKVGTSIKIQITEEDKWQRLIKKDDKDEDFYSRYTKIWQWYYLDHPSVDITIEGDKVASPELYPAEDAALPITWRRLKHPDYKAIHWSIEEDTNYYRLHKEPLVCNGIYISNDYSGERRARLELIDKSAIFSLNTPRISVFDSEGNLPVNLQRTEIHEVPFQKELKEAIVCDMIAYLLVHSPKNSEHDLPAPYPLVERRTEGFPVPWLLYSGDGVILADRWLMSSLGFKYLFSLTAKEPNFRREVITRSLPNTLFAYPELIYGSFKNWLEQSLERKHRYNVQEETEYFTGARIYIPEQKYKDFQTPQKYRKELRDQYKGVESINGWVELNSGEVRPRSLNIEVFNLEC